MHLSIPVHHFLHMICPNSGREQASAGSQDSFDLRDSLWAVRDVVQHMIRNDRVEGFILIRDGLRVDLLELKSASSDDQIAPRGIQHPRGKIAEGDIPPSRDSACIFLPQ